MSEMKYVSATDFNTVLEVETYPHPENYIITMRGKYANMGMSLKDIYEKDKGWFDYMAKGKVLPGDGVFSKDLTAIKEFAVSEFYRIP